jgi:protein phosphatase 1 regulatory subunit 7
VNYINAHNITAIAINNLFYFDKDINFLKECPNVKKINILSSLVENFEGLNSLNDLNVLLLDEPKTTVDISQFSKLQELYVDMNKNVVGIENCSNLRVLKLWKYKPVSKNLNELFNLINLEELVLTQSMVTSLTGCFVFSKLVKLGLYYCSKLESIKEIKECSQTLRQLSIESCKNIKDFNEVSTLKEIEKLSFINSGEVPSIKFIKQLPNLKFFVFMGTTVIDGDLSPCIGLEYVAFNEKKHYTHKMKGKFLQYRRFCGISFW